MDATHEPAPIEQPATPPPAPRRKPGRPRKYPDLAPGEKSTAAHRHAVQNRNQMRAATEANFEAFNARKMELYYKRAQKRKDDAAKLATLMAVLQTLIST